MLSVITITYRDPVGLKKTVDSLTPLYSSSIEWEHVVVDSSPEENREVLDAAGGGWPLRHEIAEAKGIYAAMNRGIEVSSGDFLWFLNGGDRLNELEALSSMLQRLKSDREIDLIAGGVRLFRDGKYLYSRWPQKRLILNIIGACRICHQGIIYRRSSLLKAGLYSTDYKVSSDYEHHFICYKMGMRFERDEGVLAIYDMSGASGEVALTFPEVRRVHKAVGSGLPFCINLMNVLVRNFEYVRISLLKRFARSKFAPVLRRPWLAWNRLKPKLTRILSG